jgi:hypothetical protein
MTTSPEAFASPPKASRRWQPTAANISIARAGNKARSPEQKNFMAQFSR